jgi:ERCC4-related helicase
MPSSGPSCTKKSSELTLIDKLSRLSYRETIKLLGSAGPRLLQAGAKWNVQIDQDVYLGEDLFRLRLPLSRRTDAEHKDASAGDGRGTQTRESTQTAGATDSFAIVTITLIADTRKRLHWNCTVCDSLCEHVGVAFALILEDKMALGLAAPPSRRTPVESIAEDALVRHAIEERRERAKTEKMRLQSADSDQPWTDYTVTSTLSGKSYRVAVRGLEPGQSYCSCPDFRTNTLGTCKHILKVLGRLKRRFTPEQLRRPYKRKSIGVHLRYAKSVALRLLLPDALNPDVEEVVGRLRDQDIDDIHDLLKRITHLERLGQRVHVYPDAEEFIGQRLVLERISRRVAEIRRAPESHPLRKKLLKAELLPYQLDGIAFAVGAGRAVLADDMGLGKTIQGIGVAELFAREAGASKVLVICPATLKSQWRSEIERFCDRDCQLVTGSLASRAEQYANDRFFTICNYEQVLRDILSIERIKWDLIILDEGQRIKNWEAKTSRVVKGLRSRFALVLSGTPLENRLDELYSVVQFIDDRRLGPAFRFYNRHRVVDESGRVLGYRNLADLRQNLQPILLRRTRASVQRQLPPRTHEIIRITPTAEQADIHFTHMQVVWFITEKEILTEMDLLRLQRELLICRMAANSTYLVDKKKPGYSTKLEELDALFERLFAEEDRKIVLFSEWTTMLDLIEPLLTKRDVHFVRLDGSVPQRSRQGLVHEFQSNPDCRVFLSSNAGSTGLNLQAANTVINVDLPWNPAVLEQRIARAYRMGQTQPVQVFILITEETIEESLLKTLSDKHDLFLAALDVESEVDHVDFESGIEELRRRLEVLLGAPAEAPLDVSLLHDATAEATRAAQMERHGPAADSPSTQPQSVPSERPSIPHDETLLPGARHPGARRDRLATTGGQLLTAAFQFLGELLPAEASDSSRTEVTSALANTLKQNLTNLIDHDDQGRPRLTFSLPDATAIDQFAQTIARLLAHGGRTHS